MHAPRGIDADVHELSQPREMPRRPLPAAPRARPSRRVPARRIACGREVDLQLQRGTPQREIDVDGDGEVHDDLRDPFERQHEAESRP